MSNEIIRRKENGTINWKLTIIGESWITFITNRIVFITIIVLVLLWRRDTAVCIDAARDPCKYCMNVSIKPEPPIIWMDSNISISNIQFNNNETENNRTT